MSDDWRQICFEQGKPCVYMPEDDDDVVITEWPNGVVEVMTIADHSIVRTWPDGRFERYRKGDPKDREYPYIREPALDRRRGCQILAAIGEIDAALAGVDLARFVEDAELRRRVQRGLAEIGWTIELLPDEVRARRPEIDWEISVRIGALIRGGVPELVGAARMWGLGQAELGRLKKAAEAIADPHGQAPKETSG